MYLSKKVNPQKYKEIFFDPWFMVARELAIATAFLAYFLGF